MSGRTYSCACFAFIDTCLSLCSRVKELKRAREHETPQKSPLAMWHHSPNYSVLFLFQPKTFYKRTEKNINANTNYYFYSSVTGSANITSSCFFFLLLFFSMFVFLPLTWFCWESGNVFYWITNWNDRGGGHLLAGIFCTFFMDCFALFWYKKTVWTLQKSDTQQGGLSDGRTSRDCSRRSQRTHIPCRNILGSNCVFMSTFF